MQTLETASAPTSDSDHKITILIIFVQMVIAGIYLISLLLVVIRRAKKLIQLRNRIYYLMVAFYIVTKLLLCSILIIQIIAGIPEVDNITAADIEKLFVTGLVLADFSITEMFLISLETYFVLCFSAIADVLMKKRTKILTISLKVMQLTVIFVLLVPLIFYNINKISYNILNDISLVLNSLIVILFLLTFFYLNFKMTGIMMQPDLNNTIRRIYKVQSIIFISRGFIIAFQILVLNYVKDSFQAYLQDLSEEYYVLLGLIFLGTVVLILLSEGLPIMYSLRNAVVQALDYKTNAFEFKQSIFTDHTSDLQSSLMDKQQLKSSINVEQPEMRLTYFRHLVDLQVDKPDAIWISKKGKHEGKEYLIRISKHEISSYIFEDIENEIALWSERNLKSLSKLSYFCEGQIIHLVEKYHNVNLDAKLAEITSETQLLKIALRLAEAIAEFHAADIVHGCLSPEHIFFENNQIILNGCGLHSLRKYLSLITGYTNKKIYTAIEHLIDKNNVILKPKKPADIYSFGMILYEIITKNRQYRQIPLKQIQLKFASENFRPKLPESIKTETKNLIRRCWHESAERRPSIQQVIDTLRSQL